MSRTTSQAITDLDGRHTHLHLDTCGGTLLGWSRIEADGTFDHYAASGSHYGRTSSLIDWSRLVMPDVTLESPPGTPVIIPDFPRLSGGSPIPMITAATGVASVAAIGIWSGLNSLKSPVPSAAKAPALTASVPIERNDRNVVARSPDGDYTIEVTTPDEPGSRLRIFRGDQAIVDKEFLGSFRDASWSPLEDYVAINDVSKYQGDQLWVIFLGNGSILKEPGDATGNAIEKAVLTAVETEAERRWKNYSTGEVAWSAVGWKGKDILQLRAQATFEVSGDRHPQRTLQAEGTLQVGLGHLSVQSFIVPSSVATPAPSRESAPKPVPPTPRPQPMATRPVESFKASEPPTASSDGQIKPKESGAADKPMAGERFAETRTRLLSPADIAAFHANDVQYAINEMFARRGAVFTQKWIANAFSHATWYRPRPEMTFDQIEKQFTPIETANFHALAKRRRDDLAASEKRQQPAPPAERRPAPQKQRDGLRDLDRY